MTQLERELKATLQIQERMFKEEIQSVSASYEKSLNQVVTAYKKQMSEALEVIERQNKTLEKYHESSQNIKISMNEKQMMQLDELELKLEKLTRQDKDLLEQLNSVLKKL